MKWNKKGLVLGPSDVSKFRFTHLQCPVALDLGSFIRVYFSSRNASGASQVFFADVDSQDPTKVLRISDKPVLTAGAVGAFDQDGVLQTCIVKHDNKIYLYYGGFSRMVTIPHTCTLGLAVSDDGGNSFVRVSEGPVLGLSSYDPFLIGSAEVTVRGNQWHLIYTSASNWQLLNGKYEQSYGLKHAVSADGIHWQPDGKIVIKQYSNMDADCRPTIFKSNGTYHMYFSTRKIQDYRQKGENAYKLGYARSSDLVTWERNDAEAGITISEAGWDSEMICYSYIVESGGKQYMFYNGNNFGKDSIGVAVLENT